MIPPAWTSCTPSTAPVKTSKRTLRSPVIPALSGAAQFFPKPFYRSHYFIATVRTRASRGIQCERVAVIHKGVHFPAVLFGIESADEPIGRSQVGKTSFVFRTGVFGRPDGIESQISLGQSIVGTG
jgi:hypothetical protein